MINFKKSTTQNLSKILNAQKERNGINHHKHPHLAKH